MMIRYPAIAVAALVCATPALGADAAAGKALFRGQCALCHSAQTGDNGGAQGPNLNGVVGRQAATNSDFSYTQALKNSKLTWDAATLDRFLTSPTSVVPGSAMVIPVPKPEDRQNLIEYFTQVKNGTYQDPVRQGRGPGGGGPPPFPPAPAAGPPKGIADWKNDSPGRMHRVNLKKLDPPYDTPSAANFPRIVAQPEGAELKVPAGFSVNVFATDLTGPRTMTLTPTGDVLLAETQSGRIKTLHLSPDNKSVAKTEIFAQGLVLPTGMAFYPNATNPQWLYVAETNRVVRYAYKSGQSVASGVPEVVIPELSPTAGGGHFTRDLVFSQDGKRMFVSVGSASNVAEDMPKKTADEVKAWDSEHGLGAAWGGETNRADVLVYDVGADKPGRVFASGIRNCVGLRINPLNGDLWCTTNERDMLGDNLVPDYSTRVREGKFYGWPWYYMGNNEDPRLKGDRPDLNGKVTKPDVPYQAHSAALNLIFYAANDGAAAFPKEYDGDGLAVMHGSWNRAFRTGHKVVRVRLKNGVPTGEYADFLVGFITPEGNAWARPVDLVQLRDGSLLLTEDGNNTIYRISYSK